MNLKKSVELLKLILYHEVFTLQYEFAIIFSVFWMR